MPTLRGSSSLSGTERRHVLWGLVLRNLPKDQAIRFRSIEVIIETIIKAVELLDPRLAREWTYEKNTIIAMLCELDIRCIARFSRPEAQLDAVGKGEIDYDEATVARLPRADTYLAALHPDVTAVMNQVPVGILDLMAIAATDPPPC